MWNVTSYIMKQIRERRSRLENKSYHSDSSTLRSCKALTQLTLKAIAAGDYLFRVHDPFPWEEKECERLRSPVLRGTLQLWNAGASTARNREGIVILE